MQVERRVEIERRGTGPEVLDQKLTLEAGYPRVTLHQLRDLTILVRKRKLKPEKGRRKDLRKIDSIIEDLQLLVPNKIQR